MNKLSRREFLRAGALTSAGLVLAACGPSPTPAIEPTEVPAVEATEAPALTETPIPPKRVVNIRFVTPDNLKVQTYRNRAKEFVEDHPELDLTIDIPDATADVQQTLLNSLAAGEKIADSTDFNVNFNWPGALVGDFHEEHFVDLTDQVQDLLPTAVNWAPGIVKGRVWGFPDLLSSAVFYYREDIFSEVGIEPNFETWDDLIEAGLKLKQDKDAFILPIDLSGFNHFQPLALMSGGGYFDKDGQVIMDSPETIRALQLMHDLVTKHEIAYPTTEFYGAGTWQVYREGTLAGAYMPTWYASFQMPGNIPEQAGMWKVTAAPKFIPDGFATAQRGGGIYPVIKGPDQDIVFEFLKFALVDVESNIRRALEVNYMPCVFAAYEDPRIADLTHEFLQQKPASLYGSIMKNAAPFYVSPYLQQAQDLLAAEVVSPAVKGEKTPEEALTGAAEKLREIAGQ